jgi:hypothetical protein
MRNQASKAEKGSYWRDNMARNVRLAGVTDDAGLAEAAAPERFEQVEVPPCTERQQQHPAGQAGSARHDGYRGISS